MYKLSSTLYKGVFLQIRTYQYIERVAIKILCNLIFNIGYKMITEFITLLQYTGK